MTTDELVILSKTYVYYIRRRKAIRHDLKFYNIYVKEDDADLFRGFERLFELNIPDPSFTFALLDLAYDGSVTLVDGEYTKVEDLVREYCKDRDDVERMKAQIKCYPRNSEQTMWRIFRHNRYGGQKKIC